MSWNNNKVSFSHLSWWRSCKRAFNLSMSNAPSSPNPIIKQAAAYGIRSEKFWDTVIGDNWAFKSDAEIEVLKKEELKKYTTEDVVKIEAGFNGCIEGLRALLPVDYKAKVQHNLTFNARPYIGYGKVDYFIDGDTPLIMDAKSTSLRDKDKKVSQQLLHYSYLNWKTTGKLAKTVAIYTKLGVVDSKQFKQEKLEGYDKFYKREIVDIHLTKEYPATPGSHCFLCGYTADCVTKRQYDSDRKFTKYGISEGESIY